MMNKAQADIAYGFTTIARADPAYYAFWLMNNVLGQYAIGGRLGDSIRERQGMAYYVSSALDANVVEGPLVDPRRRQPGERRSRGRVDRRGDRRGWCARASTAKELDESRQYLIGSMPRALETNAGDRGLPADRGVLRPRPRLRRPAAGPARAVTLDEANAAARRVDPDRATVVSPDRASQRRLHEADEHSDCGLRIADLINGCGSRIAESGRCNPQSQ